MSFISPISDSRHEVVRTPFTDWIGTLIRYDTIRYDTIRYDTIAVLENCGSMIRVIIYRMEILSEQVSIQ